MTAYQSSSRKPVWTEGGQIRLSQIWGAPKVLDSKLFRLTARASMVLEKGVGREALDEVNSGTS